VTVMKAPWSKEEVDRLARFQTDPRFHPYTCGVHSGVSLHPATDGWHCGVSNCGYTQDWAHKEDLKWLST